MLYYHSDFQYIFVKIWFVTILICRTILFHSTGLDPASFTEPWLVLSQLSHRSNYRISRKFCTYYRSLYCFFAANKRRPRHLWLWESVTRFSLSLAPLYLPETNMKCSYIQYNIVFIFFIECYAETTMSSNIFFWAYWDKESVNHGLWKTLARQSSPIFSSVLC